MSEFDTLTRVDHQQNQKKQSSLDDVEESLLFTEQEGMFIEALNVDEEIKQKQKEAFDKTESTIIINGNEETYHHTSQAEQKTIELDDVKRYVMNIVNRQDLSSNFASVEKDFFDKVELIADEVSENSFFRVETFVNVRLERILVYAKAYSENVANKLTTEERELYYGISELVSEYRKKINKRLKIDK